MGIPERKKRLRGQRKKEILDAAKTLFPENSYNGTTLRAIAEKAELSPAAIYAYFENKEDIIVALFLDLFSEVPDKLCRLADNKAISAEEKIEIFKRLMIRFYDDNTELLVSLFRLQASHSLSKISSGMIEKCKKMFTKIKTSITSVINEGVEEKIIVEIDPDTAADVLWGFFSGIVVWGESKNHLKDKKAYVIRAIESTFDLFYRGVSCDKVRT